MSSLFSIRRQMDDLMNQMMLATSPHLYHSSLRQPSSFFDNDPFFSQPLLMIDDDINNNNNTKQEQKEDNNNNNKNQDKNKPSSNTNNTSLTSNNNNNNNSNNTSLSSSFNNRMNNQWGLMKCDVHEEKDKFLVSAELPGVSKDQVKVSVDNGYLTISGDKREEKSDVKNENGREIRRSERRYGEFHRSFRLPEAADINNIQAKFENGVLNLNIPKLEKITPKVQQININ